MSAVIHPEPVEASTAAPPAPAGLLAGLGAYGFHHQEPAILAALVTGDPLLLIGRSGTGKTFLLNSISEALGLEHRHYNASLIAFDDLVGFPYPDEARESVRFLPTPATIWGAESVLVDEISRCKPEHQNRLFSLVHERRIQGIALDKLRYRWAAMNPCSMEQGNGDDYTGSEPLDPALADRFGLIVEVGDWSALSDADRRRVADPLGEGVLADDGGRLRSELSRWQPQFNAQLKNSPPQIIDYVCNAVTALADGGIRLSPRRARLMTRSLLAATVTLNEGRELHRQEAVFRQILECSLPQRAWGESPDANKVAAAHRLSWDAVMLTGDLRWVHEFHLQKALDRKAALLLQCPSPDAGTLAIEQLIANEPPERAAAFAFAAYPAAVAGQLKLGAEGVNDLGWAAQPVLTVDAELCWQEPLDQSGTAHPELARYAQVLGALSGPRQARARQFFAWCTSQKIAIADPGAFEAELHRCVQVCGGGGGS